MGACGELRYPSYMGAQGWVYPGIGLIMAYDAGMLDMLKKELGTEPPAGFPDDQNSLPKDVPLFHGLETGASVEEWKTKAAPFLKWYASKLIDHGEKVVQAAAVG